MYAAAPLLYPNLPCAATYSSSPASRCRSRLATVAPPLPPMATTVAPVPHLHQAIITPPQPLAPHLHRATVANGATHAALSSVAFYRAAPSYSRHRAFLPWGLLSGELLLHAPFPLDEHLPCHPPIQCFASELCGSPCGLFPVSALQ
jgi:hypothetical protein